METLAAPIHRSLTQVLTIAGVPRSMAILNSTLSAALVFGLHSLWGVPVAIVLHCTTVALSRRDVHFFDVFRRHLRYRNYYSS